MSYIPLLFLGFTLFFTLNALFSAAEIAMASLSRAKMTELGQRYPHWRPALEAWRDNPGKLLTMILVSSNIAVVALSTLSTLMALELQQVHGFPGWLVAALSLALSVVATLTSEIAPKVVAKKHPERVAYVVTPMLRVMEPFLGPLIRVLVKVISWLTRPFGGEGSDSLPTVTEEELKHLIDEGAKAGAIDREEGEMIRSVLAFGDTLVREVMIPRTQLDGLPVKATVEQCLDKFIDTGYTRLPVYNGDLDHIMGMLYAKDFLAVLKERELIILSDVIRPAFFVPESKKVSELLREFRKGRINMAIVVDEYGGTAGIVTLEDLVEEIIGEIRDEYDVEAGPVRPRGQDQWEVEADHSLHDFGTEIGVAFPEEGEASSVGGFVAEKLGRIPPKGAILRWGGLQFDVLDASETQVKSVLVKRLAQGPKA
jgi:putative hemolysin